MATKKKTVKEETVSYSGELNPGQRLVVDSKHYIVTDKKTLKSTTTGKEFKVK